MPETYKILGQSATTATSNTVLYTVPTGANTVVSSVVICNRNAGANCVYRVAAQTAGAAMANSHYIAFDAPIAALDTVSLSLGITLGAGDVLGVYTANGNLTFTAFGSEITV